MKNIVPRQFRSVKTRDVLSAILIFLFSPVYLHAQYIKVTAQAAKGNFALVTAGKAATLVTDDREDEVAAIAVKALQNDIELVTGVKPVIAGQCPGTGMQVLIGTLGQSAIIDELALRNLIPAAQVRGKWETFSITVLKGKAGAAANTLVIFGSDPRATAFGVFEFSKLMGVSPWVWWADVKPAPQKQLFVSSGQSIIGPPSVKYRGFFINDEDWGMRPWAAKNMDKVLKDIGPRTYEKIFELMLRLKANYLWPAMHPGTKAFWYYKENPVLAKRYGIFMGSSHHEPMLRDTEFEWNENFEEEYGKAHGDWRYDTNKEEIYRFFDDRVKQSVGNNAIYTVGMRATKDGGMQGGDGMQGKVKILEEVIHDQRQILENRLQKPANQVPQVFCPYKEVLEMYQAGLKVPEDVTITWVDDNHGYIRQLPNPQEQLRPGGSGVYYHFSYWGVPQDYLWLSSTSPVLTSFEMSKAYALQARTIWVFNVGDIKPAELELEFGMDLAWNVNALTPQKAHLYAAQWAGRTFGSKFAARIGKIKMDYYQLAAAGKPEHLSGTEFTAAEIKIRLAAYQQLLNESTAVGKLIPTRLQDAYYQLIAYPVAAAASMNEKVFYAAESMRLAKKNDPQAASYAQKAAKAYEEIGRLTARYNHETAGGKWNGMMDDHPRGREIFNMPDLGAYSKNKEIAVINPATRLADIPAGAYVRKGNDQGRLTTLLGLGSSGQGLTVLPLELNTYTDADITNAPYAEYQLPVIQGKNTIRINCLPTFPLYTGVKLRYAISVNGSKPEFNSLATLAEAKTWAHNVLRGYSQGEKNYTSEDGKALTVRIYFPDPGLVLSSLSAYSNY
jgi:hypothetical protein